MRLSARFLFTMTMVAAGAGWLLAGNDEAIQKDRKQVAGTWRVLSFERDGKKTPDELLTKTRTTFETDGTATVRRDGKIVAQAKGKIDPTKKPKQSDSTYKEGELKGKTVLGIYEIDGDNLKICYALPGKDRPTAFSAKEGSGHVLITYKRDKP